MSMTKTIEIQLQTLPLGSCPEVTAWLTAVEEDDQEILARLVEEHMYFRSIVGGFFYTYCYTNRRQQETKRILGRSAVVKANNLGDYTGYFYSDDLDSDWVGVDVESWPQMMEWMDLRIPQWETIDYVTHLEIPLPLVVFTLFAQLKCLDVSAKDYRRLYATDFLTHMDHISQVVRLTYAATIGELSCV